jgi:hypothetical protein
MLGVMKRAGTWDPTLTLRREELFPHARPGSCEQASSAGEVLHTGKCDRTGPATARQYATVQIRLLRRVLTASEFITCFDCAGFATANPQKSRRPRSANCLGRPYPLPLRLL